MNTTATDLFDSPSSSKSDNPPGDDAVTAPAVEKRITAYQLRVALRDRYEPPEWHVEEEVTLGGRRLDVVALNLWGARRYRIVGFELKVDRGDWLREITDFRKSEEWCAVADQFYVVTPSKLIRADELPEGWGHLELCGSRMMTRRHAAQKTGATLPREVAARFIGRLAEIIRQATYHDKEILRREIRAEVEKTLTDELRRTADVERRDAEEVRKQYRELLQALGLEPHEWHAQRHAMKAAGVFALTRGRTEHLRNQLEMNARALETHLSNIRDAAVALRAIEETVASNG